jgi:glycosyltransferase involved in cell wall biosynthesis
VTRPPSFSIVYPTRHRPDFVRQALAILEHQAHDDFEVVVSDNFVDPDRSCAAACEASGLARLRYVRPERPVGMVDNWNHALPFAQGDYVAFLTDKTFLLPDALTRVAQAIDRLGGPDIVSWTSDAWIPTSLDDNLGQGTYYDLSRPGDAADAFRRFSPAAALDARGRAAVSRQEQPPPDYTRGKIVFGVYRRGLIERVVDRFGALFHNINPDYTSMVLGLSEARTAIETRRSCVVGVNTDLSNGMLTDTDDAAMRTFLDSLEGGIEAILPQLLVPGVYASVHNCVARDYLYQRSRFDLGFDFDPVSWVTYTHEDIHRPTRTWSSPEVEAAQKGLLEAHLASMRRADASAVRSRLAARKAAAEARQAPPPPPRQRPAPIRAAGRLRRRIWPPPVPPAAPEPTVHDSILAALVARSGAA